MKVGVLYKLLLKKKVEKQQWLQLHQKCNANVMESLTSPLKYDYIWDTYAKGNQISVAHDPKKFNLLFMFLSFEKDFDAVDWK